MLSDVSGKCDLYEKGQGCPRMRTMISFPTSGEIRRQSKKQIRVRRELCPTSLGMVKFLSFPASPDASQLIQKVWVVSHYQTHSMSSTQGTVIMTTVERLCNESTEKLYKHMYRFLLLHSCQLKTLSKQYNQLWVWRNQNCCQ